MSKVFFLGAGFSKALNDNFPLLTDLMNENGNENIQNYLGKGSLKTHYDELSTTIKENVEELLTYLSTDLPWKSDITKHANEALYFAISDFISKKFIKLSRETQINQDIFNDFARYILNRHGEYNFITLNYDTLLEDLLIKNCPQQNKFEYEDFYQYPMSTLNSRTGHPKWARSKHTDTAPKILKLHGSANWFWAGTSPADNIYYSNGNESDTVKAGLKPYIIPPVMDKNAFYNHIAIRFLWQSAEQLLKEANEIYIVGFSFPPTDISVRFLFKSALRNSQAKIFIINSDKMGKLKKRYEEIFKENCVTDYTYAGNKKVFERFIRGNSFIHKHIIS